MEWLSVTYRISAPADYIAERAAAVAVEQSVEMPIAAIRQPDVLERVLGRVASIEPAGHGTFDVVIRLSAETTGGEAGQLLNMLFGNTSLQPDVELVDVELPDSLRSAFPGPRFGIAGVRERVGVHGRPLTATALKPQGLPAAELAQLCHTFALAGVDIIKDDHGLADQRYSPFRERVPACQAAVERANRETGRKSVYVPSLSGGPTALFEQARIARAEGVGMVMAAPMLLGLPVLAELAAEHVDVPVLAHPALAGASRIAPPLLLGKLFRLLGADAIIYPNHGGRFAYSPATCAAIADAARCPWGEVKPALPVPAGGMSVQRVDEMVEFYGPDVVLLIGGALLAAGDELPARTREFVAAVQRHGEMEKPR